VASFALGPKPAADYDAVMIFGGEANVDDDFDWLAEEKQWLRERMADGTPLLGVCLGAQLIAELAGAEVNRLTQPEIGWREIDGVGLAFEWHRYGFAHAPPGAKEAARNEAGCQEFRLGNAWAIQYHAEVDEPTVLGWIRDYGPSEGVDAEALTEETRQNIAAWNEYGRDLCGRFLATAR
jgi:GMP synthase-like glutamine amidotransferase